MRNKLIIEGIISLVSILNTTPANGSDLQQKILINPTTYSIELRLEPLKALNLKCQTSYVRLEPNGMCSFDYRKRLGIGEIEVKGYKGLTDKDYFIGARYSIKW